MAELQYHTIGGYAGVRIHPERRAYEVIEPFLTQEEKEEAGKLKQAILEAAGTEETMSSLGRMADGLLRKEGPEKRKTYKYYILRDLAGAGALEPLLRDGKLRAIRCAGAGIPIEVDHADFGTLRTNITIGSVAEAEKHAKKISRREGLRAELHAGGFSAEIRKRRDAGMEELIAAQVVTDEMLAHAWLALEKKESVLITGGDEAARNALLNAISTLIPPFRRIVSIEHERSLRIPHRDWSARVTRGGYGPRCSDGKRLHEVSFDEILKDAAKENPDHLIMRECNANHLTRCGGRLVASTGRVSLGELEKIPPCMLFRLAKADGGMRTAEILLADKRATKICEWDPERDRYEFHEDIHAHTKSDKEEMGYKMRALRWIGERGYHPPFFGLFTEER